MPSSQPDSRPDPELARAIAAATADPRRRLGRYVLLEELGRGGMGVVYRAWDPELSRLVALKLLGDRAALEPDARERFAREGRSAASLRHPGVVSVYDVGTHGDLPFLVMDYVAGAPLSSKRGSLGREEAIRITREVALALDHAHGAGIVHRDVKPENVLLDTEGRPLLTDFGLAHHVTNDGRLTATGEILGTVRYMAPEQAEGIPDGIGPPADIWALGAMLYEAFCGRPPFEAGSPIETLARILTEDPEPPRAVDPTIPEEVEAVILRCLRKDPRARFASAGALAEALGRLGEARSPRPATGSGSVARPAAPSTLVVAAITLVVLGLVALGAFLVGRSGPSDGPTDPRGGGGPSAPVARIVLPSEPIVTDGSDRRVGRVEGADVDVVWFGDVPVPTDDGRFAIPTPSTDGAHVLVVSLEKGGGGATGRVTVVRDASPPILAVDAPAPSGEAEVEVVGRVRDAHLDGVWIEGESLDEPVPVAVDDDGAFVGSVSIADDGRHELAVVARDVLGHESRTALIIVVDLGDPALTLDQPADGGLVSIGSVRVVGRVEDLTETTVTIDGRRVDAPGGSFEVEVELPSDGEHPVVVEAVDAVGRRATVTRRVVRDASPPVVEIEAPASGIEVEDASVVVRGRVADAHRPEAVTIAGRSAPLDDEGGFSTEVDLAVGENRITVAATDRAGHEVEVTRVVTRIERRGPTIVLEPELPTEVFGSARKLEVRGSLDRDGCRVEVDGREAEVARRAFTGSARLKEGENRIVVIARDPADPDHPGRLEVVVAYARKRPTKPEGTWWSPPREQLAAVEPDRPLWFESTVGLRMVLVPAAIRFAMGSAERPAGPHAPEPRRTVAIPRSFYVGATEVSWTHLAELHRRRAGDVKELSFDGDHQPAVAVSWELAGGFCRWLTDREGGRLLYRLPTEAEWEWACRAGTTTRWYWGDEASGGEGHVNANDAGSRWPDARGNARPFFDHDDGHRGSAPVGSFRPNPWGLFDVAGNVSELTADFVDPDYPEGQSPIDPVNRNRWSGSVIVRGGSWSLPPDRVRSASRQSAPTKGGHGIGFRVVAEVLEGVEIPKGTWWTPTREQLDFAAKEELPLWFEVPELELRFVLIPPDDFMMGSPPDEVERVDNEGYRPVRLTRGYYLAATETTVGQFRLFDPDFDFHGRVAPEVPRIEGGDAPEVPVTRVTWAEAESFARWLTKRSHTRLGRNEVAFGLPTEAQWERAARAGTRTPYLWGADRRGGFLDANGLGTDTKKLPFAAGRWTKHPIPRVPDGFAAFAPVGTFRSNLFGLFDMSGNASEMCRDGWGLDASTDLAVDPIRPASSADERRVIRGGSWMTSLAWDRVARRGPGAAGEVRSAGRGFRLVAELRPR